jgi:hypothetical protein
MFDLAAIREAIADAIVRSPGGTADHRWARSAALETLGPGA